MRPARASKTRSTAYVDTGLDTARPDLDPALLLRRRAPLRFVLLWYPIRLLDLLRDTRRT
jgi:hypothetical protein